MPMILMRGRRLRPIFSPAVCAQAAGIRLPGKAISTPETKRAMKKTYGGSGRSPRSAARRRASATQDMRLRTRNDQVICWECVIQYSTPAAFRPPPPLSFHRRSSGIAWSAALPRVQKKMTETRISTASQISIGPYPRSEPKVQLVQQERQ